jgi:DMSO/TMAO reductase YedYZ molybdopterin-dependent catalytic subunit
MEHRLYGSGRRGVALGLVASFAGLAVAELVVGLVRDASSPVVPVGQEVIDAVPPGVKDWAIDTFGTADKPALVIGTFLVLGVIGSLVGVLAVRGRAAAAYAVTVAVGVVGAMAVLARPDPTFGKLLPTTVGSIVSIGVLWWLAPGASPVAATDTDAATGTDRSGGPRAIPRRGFVEGAATVGVVAVALGAIGRALRGRFEVAEEIKTLDIPEPVESVPAAVGGAAVDGPRDFGIDQVESWVVPNDDFYRIDTALTVPQVSRESWSLRVHGMVDRELELTFADVLARPMIERYVTLSCVSNEVGGDLVGNALFQGIRLKDLLDEAGVRAGATQVVSRSIDGWDCGSPTSVIMDGRDAMLAIAMNGEPLPPEHGYPARLVVPGLYGYVSATKWVTEIELTRWEDFDGYWIPRGWAKEAPVKTMARIDRPRRGRTYEADAAGAVDIGGLAWAVHRGISRVEVSIDDAEWVDCEMAGVPSDDTWRQWRHRWVDASPGEHTVRARAWDGNGEPQPSDPASPAPDGAQGYHQVRFTVS